MTWFAWTFMAPVITILMVALILKLVDRSVSRKWPKMRVGRLLFDKVFRERYPVRFLLNWISVIGLWFLCNAAVYLFVERLSPSSMRANHEVAHHH